MKNIIYFFTGTGNSLYIANEIANKLTNTDVISILKLNDVDMISEEYNKIGFVFPAYCAHAPSIVTEILSNIKFNENQKIFIITTGAGNRGFALADVRNVIKKNNKNLILEFAIRMPGNYILEYEAFPHIIQNQLLKNAIKSIDKICEHILKEESSKIIEPNYITKVIDSYSKRIILNYKYKSKDYIATDKCTLCKVCIKVCPSSAIEYKNKINKRNRYINPNILLKDMIKINN